MVLVGEDPEEQSYDDMTIGLQLQQFLDEWHYRVIHSNLATVWDRNEAALKAMELIEMNGGTDLDESEKQELTEVEESEMVERIVKKMSLPARKAFEHFVLQLQLVVSTATRVRHSLEEVEHAKMELLGSQAEDGSEMKVSMQQAVGEAGKALAKAMEDGDTGITQQILKQAVIEAAIEVNEISELRESWVKSTEQRVGRLAKCSDEAEHAKQQLDAIRTQLDSFGDEQNSKSKSVLMSVAANQDKALLHTIFSSWYGSFLRYKAEKEIHDKFRKQIADAEDKLIQYKNKQLNNVRGVLQRKAAETDGNLLDDIIRLWRKIIKEEKGDVETQQKMKLAQDKLAHMQQAQVENNKKVMMRMSAGSDMALLQLCWQAWNAFIEEYRKNKEMEDAVKKAEQQLAEFTKRKSEEAKGVLNRMSGATESGLKASVFGAWRDYFIDWKKSLEMEELLANGQGRLKSLSAQQKGAANGVMTRLHELEEEIFVAFFFQTWSAEASLSRVTKHYAGKYDQKKHQLEAVQTMFKSFAVQLEQGIGNAANTPRSQRSKSQRASLKDGGEKPPQIPAA